jgi:hypothetical protein
MFPLDVSTCSCSLQASNRLPDIQRICSKLFICCRKIEELNVMVNEKSTICFPEYKMDILQFDLLICTIRAFRSGLSEQNRYLI